MPQIYYNLLYTEYKLHSQLRDDPETPHKSLQCSCFPGTIFPTRYIRTRYLSIFHTILQNTIFAKLAEGCLMLP